MNNGNGDVADRSAAACGRDRVLCQIEDDPEHVSGIAHHDAGVFGRDADLDTLRGDRLEDSDNLLGDFHKVKAAPPPVLIKPHGVYERRVAHASGAFHHRLRRARRLAPAGAGEALERFQTGS